MKNRGSMAGLLLLGIYVLSYILLSSSGAYAPAAWGTNGVKWYAWAPVGFYSVGSGEWLPTPLRFIYAPLSIADQRFWHTHGYMPEATDRVHPMR
jgi:hypothetical protein